MRFLSSLILLFCSFAIITKAGSNPEYPVSSIAPELLENANSVIRLEKEVISLESLNKYTEEVHKVITILNGKARDQYFSLHYDKITKINKLEARILDSEGNEVRKIKKSEIMDFSSYDRSYERDDDRFKSITFSNRNFPYTIEIKYKRTLQTLHFPFLFMLENVGKSYEERSLLLKVKNGILVDYKNVNTDLEPTISSDGDYKVYLWNRNNLPSLIYEQYSAYDIDLIEYVIIRAREFRFDDYTGSFSSWESYGQFLYDLNKDRYEVSPELVSVVKELTADAATDREKIEILYQYLQDNTRYVSVQLGIGGYQTFDALYVEQNKFGDCKALSNFMGSLLNIVGIESYSACIYRGEEKRKYWEDFAVPFFNHVIQYVPSEEMWLECTMSNYPAGYIGGDNDDKKVLIYTEDGGLFTSTPPIPEKLNFVKSTYKIDLDIVGGAKIKGEKLFSGKEHDYLRYLYSSISQSDFKEAFLKSYPLTIQDLDKMELSINDDLPQATISYEANIPRYGSKAGKRIFVPLNPFNLHYRRLPSYKERKHDVVNKRTQTNSETIEILLPHGYQIETMPDMKKEINSEFGDFSFQLELKENSLILNRTFILKAFHLPPDRYVDLKDFFKQVDKIDNTKLVLVKKKT